MAFTFSTSTKKFTDQKSSKVYTLSDILLKKSHIKIEIAKCVSQIVELNEAIKLANEYGLYCEDNILTKPSDVSGLLDI